MKVFEASKKAGWFRKYSALAIASVIQGETTVESEMRHIKEALVGWHQRQGKRCKDLKLVFTADETQHPAILKYVTWAFNADEFISDFSQGIEVDIALLNLKGKPCRELRFGAPR